MNATRLLTLTFQRRRHLELPILFLGTYVSSHTLNPSTVIVVSPSRRPEHGLQRRFVANLYHIRPLSSTGSPGLHAQWTRTK